MPNSFSARPSRTITISSSAPTQYIRAPLRCAKPRRESRRSARVSFKKADFKHSQSERASQGGKSSMRTAFRNRIETWAAVAFIAVALAASGCSRATSAAGPQRAPDVELVRVEERDIPVYREWIGTVDGMVNAAIRAQVTGYL